MFVYIDIAGDRQRKLFEVSQIAGSHGRRANLLNSRDDHAAERGDDSCRHERDTPAFTD